MDQPTGVGVIGRSRSGVASGQRALLEADDAVGDVHSVGVDRCHAGRCEVVREVSSRVELAVLGAVAAAFLVRGAPGEVAEEAGPARGYRMPPKHSTKSSATWLFLWCSPARRGSRPCGRARGPRLWCGQSAGARGGGRARGTQRRCGGGAPPCVEPKAWVWPMRWQPAGGALARRGEGTFDSPSQSVPHAESPGLMRSGTWPALYCLYARRALSDS